MKVQAGIVRCSIARAEARGPTPFQPGGGAHSPSPSCGRKRPEAAVKEAQRKADEIMLPYVQSTAYAVGSGS
jgi:hypothetical protein